MRRAARTGARRAGRPTAAMADILEVVVFEVLCVLDGCSSAPRTRAPLQETHPERARRISRDVSTNQSAPCSIPASQVEFRAGTQRFRPANVENSGLNFFAIETVFHDRTRAPETESRAIRNRRKATSRTPGHEHARRATPGNRVCPSERERIGRGERKRGREGSDRARTTRVGREDDVFGRASLDDHSPASLSSSSFFFASSATPSPSTRRDVGPPRLPVLIPRRLPDVPLLAHLLHHHVLHGHRLGDASFVEAHADGEVDPSRRLALSRAASRANRALIRRAIRERGERDDRGALPRRKREIADGVFDPEAVAVNLGRGLTLLSLGADRGVDGGSVSATLRRARLVPASLASSRSNASGSSSVILPLPVTHNTGVSNANAPGRGASTNPPGVPQLLRGDPSSHAPSQRPACAAQSSTSRSAPRRWTRAGMPSPIGAGSFSQISTRLTLRTSFLPPLARAARASASPPDGDEVGDGGDRGDRR